MRMKRYRAFASALALALAFAAAGPAWAVAYAAEADGVRDHYVTKDEEHGPRCWQEVSGGGMIHVDTEEAATGEKIHGLGCFWRTDDPLLPQEGDGDGIEGGTYTVVYDVDGEETSFPGLSAGDDIPDYGADPEKPGFTFAGWELAGTENGPGTGVNPRDADKDGVIRYVAKWDAASMEGVALEKTASPRGIGPGGTATVYLTIRNDSGQDMSFQVGESLPDGMSIRGPVRVSAGRDGQAPVQPTLESIAGALGNVGSTAESLDGLNVPVADGGSATVSYDVEASDSIESGVKGLTSEVTSADGAAAHVSADVSVTDGSGEGGITVNVDGAPFGDWPAIPNADLLAGASAYGEGRTDEGLVKFTVGPDGGMFPGFGTYNGWNFVEGKNTVLEGKWQDPLFDDGTYADHIYVETTHQANSGYVTEVLTDGSRKFFTSDDGLTIRVPMRARYVMRGGYAGHGIEALQINVALYNHYKAGDEKSSVTTLWGTKYGYGAGMSRTADDAVTIQVQPTAIRVDGNEESMRPCGDGAEALTLSTASIACTPEKSAEFGAPLARLRHEDGSDALVYDGNDTFTGWGHVLDSDVEWTVLELDFDIIFRSKTGKKFNWPDSEVINSIATAPINYYYVDCPTDSGSGLADSGLEGGHAASKESGAGSLFEEYGVGRAVITNVWYPLEEGGGFNIGDGHPLYSGEDYGWIKDLAYGPAVAGSMRDDGFSAGYSLRCSFRGTELVLDAANSSGTGKHPDCGREYADWTIEACKLQFDGNGGSVSAKDGMAEKVDDGFYVMYRSPSVIAKGGSLDRTFSGLDGMSAEKPGHTFIGWATDEEGSDLVINVGNMDEDKSYSLGESEYEGTLYAVYEKVSGPYVYLPATGGTGIGMLALLGMAGLILGAMTAAAARRKQG